VNKKRKTNKVRMKPKRKNKENQQMKKYDKKTNKIKIKTTMKHDEVKLRNNNKSVVTTTPPKHMTEHNRNITDYSQVKGSPDMDVYALKWKGSRCISKSIVETPIGGRAPPGASGSRADGSEVESLTKNSIPRVHNTASYVNRTRAEVVDTANQATTMRAEHKKYKQGDVRIGTLNIHGKKYANGIYKYKDLTTLIRKNKIAILALQESRLNESEKTKIELMCPKIEVISNSESTAKEGIAFVINKDQMKDRKLEHKILIKNRMSRLTVKWNEEITIDVVNIYAPNNEKEKIIFFKKANHIIKKLKNKENMIIMGDFNSVEDKLDRLPMTKDDNKVITELQELTGNNKMIDGWRNVNPESKEYTYESTTGSLARIDRIYIKEAKIKNFSNWITITSANISDHDIVTVEIQKLNTPYIGKGLWKMDVNVLEETNFKKRITKLLIELEDKLTNLKEKNEKNKEPQRLWYETKENIRIIAKEVTKQKKKEQNKKKENITKEIKRLKNQINKETTTTEKERLTEEIRYNKHVLAEYEKDNIKRAQQAAKKSFHVLGESCSKWYFNLNKERKEKEYITKLINKEGKTLTKTEDMVRTASEHHKELQKEQMTSETRRLATQKIHKAIKSKLSKESIEMLEKLTEETEIRNALKKTANNKAPGKDGIPYEFYKMWIKPHRSKERKPDITYILNEVYNNIEREGTLNEKFAEGAMCLLYKKKEKTNIENYRPITLLNTDYKLYTKTIATKLGEVAKEIIHPNQAGFVPKRSLYDSTRTTHMMIEYAEINELEGCIIALDQEKAYDKIAHDYLWKTLKAFKFPENFINKVKTLYEKANTAVIVNGVIPKGIEIKRGVRQGDPMSCLLYNIAIEPLACTIRASKLKGYKIKYTPIKVLISMFADDTLIYMNANDDYRILEETIETFCTASTAKFNKEKTEYLPIGPKDFRDQVIETRKINEDWVIPQNVKIIKNGEAMRTLGTWVGNDVNVYPQWEKILEHQKKTMEKWSATRPSLKGKEVILKALVQSKALFLATVNGMPKDIQEKMKKQMKDFIWDNKNRGLMKWEEIIQERQQGGLGIPDIEARLDAIQIMWLKKYLAPEEKKPDWAYIADKMIFKFITPKPIIEEKSRIDWILQSWHESESKSNKIPMTIHKMLKTARKYNTGYEARKVEYRQKLKMPVWHNFAINENWLWNKKAAKCLRNNHEVRTTEDLVNERRKQYNHNCENDKNCNEMINSLMNQLPELIDPVRNTPRKDMLDHTPKRKEKNKKANKKENKITFNPDITEREDPRNAIRIFRKENNYKIRNTKAIKVNKPAYRNTNKQKLEIEIYTDGSCTKNGMMNAQCGAGVWISDNNKDNKAISIIDGIKTNQRAELIAIIEAIKIAGNRDVTIFTDSMTCIENIVDNIPQWEDKDWIDVKNSEDWKALVFLLRKKAGTTEFQWIKGHSGIEGNEKADRLADKGRTAELKYQQIEVPENFQITGARLQTLTQAQAYKLILRQKRITPGGTNTAKRLEYIQEALNTRWEMKPTKESIWKNLYNQDMNRKVSDFLWKIIHKRVKCGTYFSNIPNWEDKQYCYRCRQIESVDHILIGCLENHQKDIWEETEKLMTKLGEQDWKKPDISTIMAVSAIQIDHKDNKEKAAKQRRLRTIIAETIWTIWKLRNKEIFEEVKLDKNTWKNEWKRNIEERITLEYSVTQGSHIIHWKQKLDKFVNTWGKDEKIVEIRNKKLTIKLT